MRYLNERDEDWESWTDELAEIYQSQREDEEREYARQADEEYVADYVREHGLTTIISEGYDNDTNYDD